MRMAGASPDQYPSVADLRKKAMKRTPFFAFEYLDSGTGREIAQENNETALNAVKLVPELLRGNLEPKLDKTLFGHAYSAPLGVAPVGMSSLMWPGAEQYLSQMAVDQNIPYCLSTVAAESIEVIGELAGKNAWFQLYCPKDATIRDDLISRAADAGFSTLVVTADVPTASSRERQRRAGLSMPPKMDARTILRILSRPAWLLATLQRGRPKFRSLEKYASTSQMQELSKFVGTQFAGSLDWECLAEIRKLWKGPLILKGILSVSDAKLAVKAGIDGVWVSNHGGRQMDAAPASIDCLPRIVDAVSGKSQILFDGGIRTGLDVVRAIRLGADFVFAGRPFLYGVCALGETGAQHTFGLLRDDLQNNMIQLGCKSYADIVDLELQ